MSCTHTKTQPPAPSEIWNGAAGRAWVEAQSVLDEMFSGIADHLTGQAVSLGARDVLDVGCGAGATTLQIAEATGRCTGVDVSAPLIEHARRRAGVSDAAARFILDDAQTHAFETGAFDLIVSRFGVMFFTDPKAAFANLRRAARAGGGMHLVAWRSARENAFLTLAERAAEHMLPELSRRKDGVIGPFAFADPEPVKRMLEEAGWQSVRFEPVDFQASFSADALELYMTRLGAVGQVFAALEPQLQQALIDCVRKAYEPYLWQGRIRFTAACWAISAVAPTGASQ